MRKPAATIIGTLAVFFAALLISLTLSLTSTQEIQTPDFRLSVTMPAGSTLEKTDAVVSEIESRLASLPEKAGYCQPYRGRTGHRNNQPL